MTNNNVIDENGVHTVWRAQELVNEPIASVFMPFPVSLSLYHFLCVRFLSLPGFF